eukprot:6206781-Pleurochrysis_carterae.AAC.1
MQTNAENLCCAELMPSSFYLRTAMYKCRFVIQGRKHVEIMLWPLMFNKIARANEIAYSKILIYCPIDGLKKAKHVTTARLQHHVTTLARLAPAAN